MKSEGVLEIFYFLNFIANKISNTHNFCVLKKKSCKMKILTCFRLKF